MRSEFRGLAEELMGEVDPVMAEPLRLSFMKDGRLDPGREQRAIEAVLRIGGGKETSAAGSQTRSWRTRISAQRGELHVDRIAYPDLVVNVGDRVQATERSGKPWFEVLGVDDRHMTRLVVQLGEV